MTDQEHYDRKKAQGFSADGMMLRDYFAAQAIQAILAARTSCEDGPMPLLFWGDQGLQWNCRDIPADVARLAYQVAEAMLSVRKE